MKPPAVVDASVVQVTRSGEVWMIPVTPVAVALTGKDNKRFASGTGFGVKVEPVWPMKNSTPLETPSLSWSPVVLAELLPVLACAQLEKLLLGVLSVNGILLKGTSGATESIPSFPELS